ncbi:hypothetical protein JCM9957A_25200 [Kineosporia succinea]|uniref:Uncharacterized protein n=1 Tax=Kineosporia succinea TaxID=84632 RepID=A0ABT9P2N5_9ACTN|nr:hypothetical protein [Kineosporia succinea]
MWLWRAQFLPDQDLGLEDVAGQLPGTVLALDGAAFPIRSHRMADNTWPLGAGTGPTV